MITLNAYAKVNLFLKIKEKRTDGYHEIESIMQKLDLHDVISLEINSTGIIEILNSGGSNSIDIPWDETNLVFKAAKIFKETLKIKDGCIIKIKKGIPASAGLGGGSSDAAATLIGVNRLWNTNLPKEILAQMGEKIGSDVPFFLYRGTALVTGKGEKVFSLPSLPKIWFILIKPPKGVSTRWAYENFDLINDTPEQKDINEIINCLKKGNEEKIFKMLYNDMERVVFKYYPELKDIKDFLLGSGAQNALLSGSGSTIFGICKNKKDAYSIYNKITPCSLGEVYVCCSIT
ncbi:4-(cytidine 5'-diphospho)-2-C-methyl-D-erythritol kinase [Candidatus Desantisbacteria bacterium]|nr:4-(cytidine 5'-diphospho)-2-C-methyl-D-erythritol kinase [Candidatus Desantisbacteria bacterium]